MKITRKLGVLLGTFFMVALLAVSFGAPVMAQPITNTFTGSVTINGVAAQPGTVIAAYVAPDVTTPRVTITTIAIGAYAVTVFGDAGDDGLTVTFEVNGILAPQTGTFSGSYESETVNLATGVSGGPYTLQVAVSPSGSGTVSKSPDLANYPNNTVVTLTATAGSGYDFSSWSGDASGTSVSTTVTMDGNKSVTATFVVDGAPVEQPEDVEGGLDDIVVADSDIIFMAVAPDGTLFASVYDADDNDYTIMRSTDQGYTWKDTKLKEKDEALISIAISSNYEDDEILYVLGEDANVWRLENAGSDNPTQLRDINDADNGYAIATMYDGDENFVAVGTEDDVYVIEDTYFADWVDQELGDACIAIAFAPDFEDAELIWAVTDKGELKATVAPGKWGDVLGTADLTDPDACPGLGTVEVAAIAFPDDYESDEGSILFVGVGDGAGNGNILLVDVVDAPDGSFPSALLGGDDDISSIAVSGDADDAEILAGNYEGKATIYQSLNGGDKWEKIGKQPTGENGTIVVMAPGAFDEDEGVAYCGTAGMESALSVTEDGGSTWNQISLIDTFIAEIVDLGFADSENYFMITQGATSSVWRTDNAGDDYERVFCSILEDVDAKITLVAVSEEDAEVVYLAGNDGTKSVTLKSRNNGQKFDDGRSVEGDAVIADWLITEDDTIYAATNEGFYNSTNSGRTWDTFGKTGPLNSIALSPDFDSDETIIVGTVAGNVWMSERGGAPFDNTDAELTGKVFVAFDTEYADNDLIYAAGQDEPIQAGEVADTNDVDWEDMENNPNAEKTYTPDGCSGLEVSSDSVLYAIDESEGIVRLLIREYKNAWETGKPLDIVDPKGLWITEGSNTLWSTEGVEVWSYEDELTGHVTLLEPADGSASTRLDRARLSWEELASTADEYELEVNTREDFKGSDFSPDDSEITSADAVNLPNGRTLYWKVRVADGEELQSRWSDVWSFTTALGEGQWNPFKGGVDEAPAPGATGVSLTPTFAWNAADWTTTYEFELAKDAAFSDAVVSKTVEGTSYLSESALDYSTTYYWKVRAKGASSYSEWSNGVFTTMAEPEEPPPPVVIEENPPATITLPAPIVNIPPTPAPITPAFIWAIVIIGAILVIAVIVLIVRTRRVS